MGYKKMRKKYKNCSGPYYVGRWLKWLRKKIKGAKNEDSTRVR